MADPKDGGQVQEGSASDKGNQSQDWRASAGIAADDPIWKEKSLETVKDVPSLVKGFVEAQKMIGGSIRLPNDKMKPEEAEKAWGDIYAKLGRPENADKYDTKVLPEAAQLIPEADIKAFKSVAFKAGLSGKQAQAMIDHYQGVLATNVKQLKEQGKLAEESLRGEWGAAFDRNVGLAARAVIESGGKDLLKYLDESGLGNHPALIKAFAKMGQIMSDEGYMEGEVDGGVGPAEAKQEIATMLNDKSGAYWNAGHPDHKDAVAKMASLHQLAYPEA